MPHNYVFRLTMLAKCRDYLITRFPALRYNAAYRRMMDYLLHPIRDDKSRWYLGHDVLRQITGGTSPNQAFLQAFQNDVLPGFAWSEPNKDNHQARTIISSGIDAVTYDYYHLAQGITHSRPGENERVYIDDGRKFSRAKKAEQTRHNDQVMRDTADDARTPIQAMILRYHADLPTNTYQALISANRADACAWVQDNFKEDDDTRRLLWGQLDCLFNFPKPYYAIPSEKTNRLYPAAGLANLSSVKREIRKILTRGCVEVDIWACHLAIIARTWHVDSLQKLLENLKSQDKKPWGWFAASLGLELTRDLKQALKQAVYSLAYGASKRNIIKAFDADSGEEAGTGKRFLELPIMQDILAARKEQCELPGIACEMSEYNDYLGDRDFGRIREQDEIRSVLSCESQKVEQELIGVVYEYAKAHKDKMQILVYSYDGVTFQISDKRPERKNAIMQSIKEAVEEKATELGLTTSVDFDDLD